MANRPPFSMIDNRVIQQFVPSIGAVGYCVYGALAFYADNDSRVCWPRQSTIAKMLGFSRQAVNDAISRLVEFGLIEILEHRSGYSNVYRLFDVVNAMPAAATASCDDGNLTAPEPAGDAVGSEALAACFHGGVNEGGTLSGGGVKWAGTIELDCLTANYTTEQQPTPAPEQAALPELAEAVVVFSSIQEIAETVIPEPAQERKERPLEASKTETLADSLPLPKKAAVKLLERAPEAERPAIVETFNAARLKRTILNPAAYLAALVQACILGTFTPEAAQQAQRDQEKRRRNAEALARSNAEMERRAMERLGLASPNADTGGTAAVPDANRAKAAAKWAALRASLRGGVLASPGG